MYDKMNEELLEDLRGAMKLKSEPLGNRTIKYIMCHNCADSGLIFNKAVEITFTLEEPESEQAPIQEEEAGTEAKEKAGTEAGKEEEAHKLPAGGRKSKRRKSKRRKSTKRRKSLK